MLVGLGPLPSPRFNLRAARSAQSQLTVDGRDLRLLPDHLSELRLGSGQLSELVTEERPATAQDGPVVCGRWDVLSLADAGEKLSRLGGISRKLSPPLHRGSLTMLDAIPAAVYLPGA